MLTPDRQIVLLPQDREIMALTGMSEKDYRFFVRQAILHSKLRPGEPTNFLVIPFLIQLAIGVALTFVASLLAPKPRQPKAPSEINVDQKQGQTLVDGSRYTPKAGFDSVQNVVELGSVVPIVYTKRQTIGGIGYGGVRVNTNLLWSQLYSIGGGQLLRAVFLVGEATVPVLDPTQFAIGNNLISNYDLERRDAGRICIYYSSDGGRLTSADYIAGVEPANDVGNAENNGAGDVFQVRSRSDAWTTDFCFTSTPSNQTSFGLYGLIGNNLGYRINPRFRPARTPERKSSGALNCTDDGQEKSWRKKQNYTFPVRTGLVGTEGFTALNVGDTVNLLIDPSTDAERVFRQGDGRESCGDVAQAVASRQRSFDEQVSYGDLYRIGSALGICTARTAEPFVSDADNEPVGGGRAINATLEIIRAGQAHIWDTATILDAGNANNRNATQSSHVMQAAEAMFATERQGYVVEVGLRSSMQLRISGLSNFIDGRPYSRIDYDACDKDDGDKGDVDLLNFNSGTLSANETRYSFFRCAYRVAGTDDAFTEIEQLFGIRSTTGVAVYNYLRFEFPDLRRWEIRITPISGWEVRNNIATGDLEVLDPHLDNIRAVTSGDVTVRFTGEQVSRTEETFRIRSLTTSVNALETVDQSTLVGGKGYQAGTFNVELTGGGYGKAARGDIVVVVPLVPDPNNPGGPDIPDPAGGSVTSFTLTQTGDYYDVGDTLRIRNPEDVPGLVDPLVPITQEFSIDVATVVKTDLGNGFDDGEYYADAWARLAEGFIYDEITTTATQPEHEVVYLNTISPNAGTPNYEDMALVGINIRSSKEISSLSQFSVYVNEGVNSTNRFPDVLYDLLTNDRYGTGRVLAPTQIDKTSFDDAATWTDSRLYFFDGAVSERINIRSWGAEVAAHYLLDLLVRNGKFALKPVANFESAETITGLFTAGNIIEDTFEMSYTDDQDRIPPRISVVWREERETSGTVSKGLFPVIREVTVRESGTPEDAPLEKIDLSNYVTSERHAIDRAKWECRVRRYMTHTIRFKTTPTEAALDLGAVFKLGMETISYEQPANGAIAEDGTVTSWPPLADGVYDVLLWDGATNAVQERKITINGGNAATGSAVFCVKNSTSDTQTYKTQSLSFDEDGNIDVEATYFPTDATGRSLFVINWDDANWVIEGRIQ